MIYEHELSKEEPSGAKRSQAEPNQAKPSRLHCKLANIRPYALRRCPHHPPQKRKEKTPC